MGSVKTEILSRLDIVDYYSGHLQWTTKKGKNWQALCPFHSESNGSFTVKIENGFYYCFGCEAKGDVFTFQQKIANQDFNEAIRELAKRVGVDIPDPPKKNKSSGETRGRPRKEKPKLDEEFCQKMHDEMSDNVRTYLENRGITKEAIEKFKLGSWKEYVVFPIRKDGKLHNYRLKSISESRIWHLTKEDLKHEPLWMFPEPDPDQDTVLLCEGEPDAMVAWLNGFNPTTVTGGAGTFSNDYLRYFDGKKVYVCYDIDEKGKLGSLSVAKKIATVAEWVRVVSLDLDIKKYPGGDITDYFFKEGKTKEDFEKLLKKSKKITPDADDCSLVELDGCYWQPKEKKGDVTYEKITNFTLEQICRYRDVDGEVYREVFVIPENPKAQKSKKILLPSDMSDRRGFRKWCFGAGDFLFTGTDKALDDIWKLLIAQDLSAKEVDHIFGIGYVKKFNLWMFKDFAVKSQAILKADENGICWNGKRGYAYEGLETSSTVIRRIPTLNTCDEGSKKIMQSFADKLMENVGTLNALYGVAFACGSLYYDTIVDKYGSYPILWLYGQQQCGKNEFAGFLLRMFGLGRESGESIPEITSTVPMTRKLSYYGNIPVWFDEYRNSNRNHDKVDSVLRSSYSGVGRSMGKKATRGTVREDPVSPVIISGEEIPEDEALLSRLLVIRLNKDWRKDELYDDVFNLSIEASKHLFHIVKERNKASKKELISEIQNAIAQIRDVKKWSNARVILNHGIALGCYRYLVGDDSNLFGDYILNGVADDFGFDYHAAKQRKMSIALEGFVESVSVMLSNGSMKGQEWYWHDPEKKQISIWFGALKNTLDGLPSSRANQDKSFTSKTLLNHLRETDFCVKANHPVWVDEHNNPNRKVQRKCLILDTSKIPDSIKAWFPGEGL